MRILRTLLPSPSWSVLVLTLIAATTGLGLPLTAGQERRAGRRTVTVNGHEAVAGEVIVKLVRGNVAAAAATLQMQNDADVSESLGFGGRLRRLHSRSFSTENLIEFLRTHSDVEYAEPNYIVRVDRTPNDTAFGLLWGLLNSGQTINGQIGIAGIDIGVTRAWDTTTGSRANVVGVIDTGIDYTHPDLVANVWTAPSAFSVTVGGVTINCAAGTHGFNAINNTCNPMDDHVAVYHGTHVSGTIGASGNNGVGVSGVNWIASIMGLKFLGSNGSGATSDAIKAIDFAVQAKSVFGGNSGAANLRILSNSWGGGGFSQALLDAINRANAADMLFVAAAGNATNNNDAVPSYPASFAAANVVAVAAIDSRGALASFSNYGRSSVHLGAPGVDVYSTKLGSTYQYLSGTSMATPHVSGAAALVLAACGTMTTDQLKSTLLTTVDATASLSTRTSTGGRLNAYNAVRACQRVSTVTLSANRTSPQVAGSTVAWTATASGGATPYAYKWLVYNGSSYTVVADWSSSNTYVWTPSSANAAYAMQVWVRSSGSSTDAAEASQTVAFEIIAPPSPVSSVSLAVNRAAPQPARTTIVLTAAAAGGVAPAQYQWWLYNGGWSMVRDWSATPTYTWTPTAARSDFYWAVYARGAGSSVTPYEAVASMPYPISPPAGLAPRGDLVGDLTSDIVWRDRTTGANAIWSMNGLGTPATSAIASVTDTNWQIQGVVDFDGDGRSDILWRNRTTGANSLWFMNGSAIAGGSPITALSDTGWEVKGVGDVNGDGRADILWRHATTGANMIWTMNGGVQQTVTLATVPDPNWEILGFADFNGDGTADIFWRHRMTGANSIWLLSGSGLVGAGSLYSVTDLTWQVAAVADFDGDGKADVLWRRTTSGENSLWLMNGLTLTSGFYLPTVADTNWRVAGTGDFDADGISDILWRHATTGENSIWLMNGGLRSAGYLPTMAIANDPAGPGR